MDIAIKNIIIANAKKYAEENKNKPIEQILADFTLEQIEEYVPTNKSNDNLPCWNCGKTNNTKP